MRRIAVVLLSFIVLVGTMFIGSGRLLAQDSETAGHPIIGPWDLDTDTEDLENPPSWVTFSADGTYIQVDADGTVIGAWEPTGDTTAILTFSFADDEGNIGTVRASLDVAPDGQTLTASYTAEYVDPAGQSSGELGPASAEGTRMVVEGPGTPAASFEEFYGAFEGTPEATPAR